LIFCLYCHKFFPLNYFLLLYDFESSSSSLSSSSSSIILS
jgi:hypothetical protein